jgi:hypothetical protein
MKQLLMACLAFAAVWGAAPNAQAQGMTERKVLQLEHDYANAMLKATPMQSAATKRQITFSPVPTGS